jgi:hypothetical protein
LNSSEDEERFGWNAALAIMLFFSATTIVLRLFGLFPFQDVFSVSLIGLPTVFLLVGRRGFNRRES